MLVYNEQQYFISNYFTNLEIYYPKFAHEAGNEHATGSCVIDTKETGSSETSLTVYKTTRRHIPDHYHHYQPCLFLVSYQTHYVNHVNKLRSRWYIY